MTIDLQGPLDDFYNRTNQLRSIIVAIESASKVVPSLATSRPGIDLSGIGLETGNTANAMALVFLASSFEEFVREEVGQCADLLSLKYVNMPVPHKQRIRSEYWKVMLDRFRQKSNILTKSKPKIVDAVTVVYVKSLVDSARGFVVDDDAAHMDRSNFFHHSRNFRPGIVNEVMSRVGVDNIIANSADSAKIKQYFGVVKKAESASKLTAKLDEFYDRRNEIVHSLSGSTGYGVDVILDYIAIFEMTAESMVSVLSRVTGKW